MSGRTLRAVDPLGLELVLAARLNSEERSFLVSNLQRLTDDNVSLRQQKGGDFEVRITKNRASDGEKAVGTALVRDLVTRRNAVIKVDIVRGDDPHRVITDTDGLEKTEQGSGAGGPGSKVNINIDRKPIDLYERVMGTPVSQISRTPDQILLGHELVHAQWMVHGAVKAGECSRIFLDEHGAPWKETMKQQEADAVGFTRSAPGLASENALRREQGLPSRNAYTSPDYSKEAQGTQKVEEGAAP